MTQIIFEGLGSAVVSGAIAGLVAWWLLRKTQRSDAAARAADRREAAAKAVITAIMNTVDAATKSREGLKGSFPLYDLRNQIALAEGALIHTTALEEAKEFYNRLAGLRRWLREAPPDVKTQLSDKQSSVRVQLELYFDYLNGWARRLVVLAHDSYDDGDGSIPDPPELVRLPRYSPSSS
jgi:hypothetical protein